MIGLVGFLVKQPAISSSPLCMKQGPLHRMKTTKQ